VLLPGEPEQHKMAARLAGGVPVDPGMWSEVVNAGALFGLGADELEAVLAAPPGDS
jgi:LDH2 family malate/lactate/ureidoglycolate dehydrogenase